VNSGADPVIFQLYYSFVIFSTGWLVLIFVPFKFTYFGIIGAALWVPASIFSIFSVFLLGISVAQGTWSGVTIVVSFMWGAVGFQDEVRSIGLAILALFLLVTGIAAFSLCQKKYYIFETQALESEKLEEKNEASEETLMIEKPPPPSRFSPFQRKVLGIACAVVSGIFNGSSLVPFKFMPSDIESVAYIASFGVGVVVVSPTICFFYFLIKRQLPVFHFKAVSLPAMASGVIWSIANVGSIFATKYLGLTVGYPLTQLSLVIAGLWGMFLFGELQGKRTRIQFFLATAVLLAGAALLSFFG